MYGNVHGHTTEDNKMSSGKYYGSFNLTHKTSVKQSENQQEF